MDPIRLNLITICSCDIDKAVLFYEAIGLRFSKHAHGNGPSHYCSEDGGVVFEIYPQGAEKMPTRDTRLGFAVPSVDAMISNLSELGAQLVSPPKDSPWGRRAVVADFDGHRVEFVAAK